MFTVRPPLRLRRAGTAARALPAPRPPLPHRPEETLENVPQPGRPDLLELIGDAHGLLVDLQDPADVDRRPDDHEVAGDAADRRLEIPDLLAAVAMAGSRVPISG